MKTIRDIISSTKSSLVLLIIFTVAMAVATFIENSYDTVTARMLIYNSKWFETVLLLMALNFIGNLNKYNFFSWQKASGFLFHFAFILMIFGAGITRYFGVEGNMPIREGKESGIFYSSEPYLIISAKDSTGEYRYENPYYFTELLNSSFKINLTTGRKGIIKINYIDYMPNAIEKIEENSVGGINILELDLTFQGITRKIFINEGQMIQDSNTIFSFNGGGGEDAIRIKGLPGNLFISFPYNIVRSTIMTSEAITKDSFTEFNDTYSYQTAAGTFFISGFYKSALRRLLPGNKDEQGQDALLLSIESGDKKEEITVWGGPNYFLRFQEMQINGLTVQAGYGQKAIELPFTITLDDFVLERYAGSNSPSSYESKVTLNDSRKNINEMHRIFMNNVLDYDGYRFFQASYDTDEKGTVLSVNKDFWGTWVTYSSYILLGLGLLLTLVNKNSRFISLMSLIKSVRSQRIAIALISFFILSNLNIAFAKNSGNKYIDRIHAEKFSQLIVQGSDGRFQPVHTLAYDVMHKISRRDKFDFPGEEKMDAVQVFLGILVNPELWKQKKIIYIREKSVKDVIGIKENYASFDEFFDDQGRYKMEEFVENAFRKKQSDQNKFDKEIIKVDERLNIMMMVMKGDFLRIFPEQGSAQNRWLSWDEKESLISLEGNINSLNDEMKLPVFNYSNIFRLYFTELIYASNSGNYERVDMILSKLEHIQKQSSPEKLLPSKKMIDFEIQYNKINIFENLKNFYGVLSIFLLLLSFIENLKAKRSIFLSLLLNFLIILAAVAFVFHTYGMGLRWYLTGHAPWSNGYETLILVAWSSMLSGFCFLRYSKITIAATTLLAFFTLMTAGHSSYDPQLTNLVPVLKSYWLIFHVAALVISYGFFGLGFVLALIIIIMYLFTNKNNYIRNSLLIKEWTLINEMNITIGLVLASIGTFLGGIWANESWGRYWGWDAKETWALIIIIVYSIILHLRLVPKLRGEYLFNVAAVLGFGTVLMTFFGVNYYFTKGLHSYASGDSPVFPLWVWLIIGIIFTVVLAAGFNYLKLKKFLEKG